MSNRIPPKNTVCLWFNNDAEEAANFYARTFPDSAVTAVHRAPADYPSGKEGDVITMTDIYQFEQAGYENGKVIGRLRPTGLRPRFYEKIEAAGIHLPPSLWGIGEGRRR